MYEIVPRVNEDNPDPRVACALALDTSGSMLGSNRPGIGQAIRPIDELNRGLQKFVQDAGADELTRKQAEITIVTFGGGVRIEVPFCEVRDFCPPELQASGSTPMGEAIALAAVQLEQRKQQYRDNGIEYYRPWLIVMSDGMPNDIASFDTTVQRLNELEYQKAVAVFPIAIGKYADTRVLSRLSVQRDAIKLKDVTSFSEFFVWLSRSLARVSQSNAHAEDDAALGQQDTQVSLPPVTGWATV